MMLRKQFANLLSLAAGLLILLWGLVGLLKPIAASAAAEYDPSLDARGFRLPTAAISTVPDSSAVTASTPVSTSTTDFTHAWEQVPVSAAVDATAAPTAGPLPSPTATFAPTEAPAIPDRIVIPAIELDAPVVAAPSRTLTLQEQVFEQWLAPEDYAAGWHSGSALLGMPGNTVINGHHNVFGSVFARLDDLLPGAGVTVYSGERQFQYVVTQSLILRERNATLAEREANAQWIMPSTDERLTLVTCWPAKSNTHRLLIVASPLR